MKGRITVKKGQVYNQILYFIKSSFFGKAGHNKKLNKDQDLPPELVLATGQESQLMNGEYIV